MSTCERCGQRLQQRNHRLAHALVDAELGTTELARLAELSRVTVGGVLSGRIAATAKVRALIAAALDRDEHELFDDDADEQVSA